jgi:hypothetical protein
MSGISDREPHGIRVNTIVCGTFHTSTLTKSIPTAEIEQHMTAQIALGRIASPDEFVAMAVFLASDASAYMTGALLSLDGGIGTKFSQLFDWYRQGLVKPAIGRRFPLTDAAEAMRVVFERRAVGKVVTEMPLDAEPAH